MADPQDSVPGNTNARIGSDDALTVSGERSADAELDALLRQVAALDEGDIFEGEPIVVGERFARFEILSELGRGGMGIVYLADDTSLRRRVALKVLPATAASDPDRRRRLLREARAAAAVSHPSIAAVHEVGEVDGRIYLAMEYVDGETLRARMARGRLDLDEILAIARAILAGLAAAHAARFVHRDLKPDNIMLARDGGARILDFGLAKRSGSLHKPARHDELTSLVTRAGHVLGTPAYMSPEQAVGDPVDARSDIFSFGVLLYEMLVGRRPFIGASQVALITSLLGSDPEPPFRARPDIGPELSAVVLRCLAKQPDARFPDAAAVARALDAARVPAASRSRRLVAIAALTLALVGSWVAWRSARSVTGATPGASTAPLSPVPAARVTLGETGSICHVGADCVSGRCAVDRCGPWFVAVEGQGADSTNAVAVLPDGQIVATGWFRGTINLGCGWLTAVGTPDEPDGFVARFKREGTCIWSRRFGGPVADIGNEVVLAANGHVVVAGEFGGTIDLGGHKLPSRGAQDIVVFELDERGNHVWSKTIGGPGQEIAYGGAGGILRDRAGNLIVIGNFASPSLDLGDNKLSLRSPGYGDIFVTKLSPSGDVLWSRAIASPSLKGTEIAYFAAIDSRGDIAIQGSFYETLDLETGPLVSAGEADAFLVKLLGADGSALWGRRFGTAADEPYEGAVAFDEAGNLFTAGEHRGADLGGGVLPGSIYIARLTASGEHVWSRGFGGESPRDCTRRVVLGLDGNPVVFGRFLSSSLELDGHVLPNAGGFDVFVARFDAGSGHALGVKSFFATYAPTRALAIDRRTGNIVVGGRFEGSIDFGAGPHKALDQDGYFASLGPAP
jgi:predicted Ser/Thr protein kinase